MRIHKITIGKTVYWDITDCSGHEKDSLDYYNAIANDCKEICIYETKNLRACYLHDFAAQREVPEDFYAEIWAIIPSNFVEGL